jgi:hypothetical protein
MAYPNHSAAVYDGKNEAPWTVPQYVTSSLSPQKASKAICEGCVFLTYFTVQTKWKDSRP